MAAYTGINITKLNGLKRDVQNYIEKIHTVFAQIDMDIENINNNLSIESGILKNKYALLKDNYNIIEKNLNKYIDDIGKIAQNYKKTDRQLASLINYDISKLK